MAPELRIAKPCAGFRHDFARIEDCETRLPKSYYRTGAQCTACAKLVSQKLACKACAQIACTINSWLHLGANATANLKRAAWINRNIHFTHTHTLSRPLACKIETASNEIGPLGATMRLEYVKFMLEPSCRFLIYCPGTDKRRYSPA